MRDVIVTTSQSPSDAVRRRAHRLAARWGLAVTERGKGSLAAARGGAAIALVVTARGLVAESSRGRLAFHSGTAAKRLRTMRLGGTDPLVRAGELRPGDRVLDATLGLGHDALVAARAVGPSGAVLGVEADLVLAVLAHEGVTTPVVEPGSAPITVRHGDSRELLTTMAAAGERVDVVLLDPMFDRPQAAEHGFTLAREYVAASPLEHGWVEAAREIATRWVVVTAEHVRPWFAEVGLERLAPQRSGRWFRTAGAGARSCPVGTPDGTARGRATLGDGDARDRRSTP